MSIPARKAWPVTHRQFNDGVREFIHRAAPYMLRDALGALVRTARRRPSSSGAKLQWLDQRLGHSMVNKPKSYPYPVSEGPLLTAHEQRVRADGWVWENHP